MSVLRYMLGSPSGAPGQSGELKAAGWKNRHNE